jgi:prepilin-type N-terminal cleavage/methylation domain-containing protein
MMRRTGRQHGRSAAGGFTLVEVVVSSAIISILLVAALHAAAGAAVARQRIEDRSRATLLGQALLSEILRQAYQEPVDLPLLGREGGELADTTRLTFDDVDDYNQWSESPPCARDGAAITGFEGWGRSVRVVWLDPDDLSADPVIRPAVPAATKVDALADVVETIAQPTAEVGPALPLVDLGVKRITVAVSRGGVLIGQYSAIRTSAGPGP